MATSYSARSPADYYMQRQQTQQQQFMNLLNLYLQKQQTARQQKQQEFENKYQTDVMKPYYQAKTQEMLQPEPMKEWQYKAMLTKSLDLSNDDMARLYLGDKGVLNKIDFSDDTLGILSKATGINAGEIKTYPRDLKTEVFKTYLGGREKSLTDYKERQKSMNSQINKFLTDVSSAMTKIIPEKSVEFVQDAIASGNVSALMGTKGLNPEQKQELIRLYSVANKVQEMANKTSIGQATVQDWVTFRNLSESFYPVPSKDAVQKLVQELMRLDKTLEYDEALSLAQNKINATK